MTPALAMALRIPVGLTAAALIFLDTVSAASAMIGGSPWGQALAAMFPILATILVFAKRPVALLLLHLGAELAIYVRNQRLGGYDYSLHDWMVAAPFALILALWAWWAHQRSVRVEAVANAA